MTDQRRNPPERAVDEDDVLTDEAADAIEKMEAHEERRDGKYDTGGDDQNPGIDTDIGANAPKELDLPPNQRGKT